MVSWQCSGARVRGHWGIVGSGVSQWALGTGQFCPNDQRAMVSAHWSACSGQWSVDRRCMVSRQGHWSVGSGE